MNQSGDEQAECPLCMEPFEVDDLNFFPCTCGYQICRFCWHRIRTDENGLCPACRKAYPENPADFKPLSQEQVAKLKAEKRQKEQQRKQKATESRKHLANVRVVQKNLVFVVGLPIRLAEPNVLKKHEYFGKFGKIQKVVINQSTSYAGALGPSASAYVTYNRYEDALRAIQAINNIWVDNRQIKTSLGTTKYCSHFIKAQTCPKPDCMYLHDLGDPEASFTKEEMQRGKHQEYERNLFEQFNNTISQERKTTPSPPALGNGLPSSDSTSTFPSATKEAWLSTQGGTTTQTNPGGGTVTTSAISNPGGSNVATTGTAPLGNSTQSNSTTLSKQQPQQQQSQNQQQQSQQQQQQQQPSSKTKAVKEKNASSNEKSTSNKKKGKEKQMNGTNNSSKDSLPNGFIKIPENVSLNYELGFSDVNDHSDKDNQEVESKLLTNNECERITTTDSDTEKCLVNGFQTENVNSPFDKGNFNQRHNCVYQNGGLNFSNNICQQNIFNNYISLNKFGGQLKSDNLLMENNDVFLNQNNHLLGQQNYLLKQQLAQQQRNQPNLQQILIQQQQNMYPTQNHFSQDFRLVQHAQQQQQQAPPQQQQSSPQSVNGLHTQNQHFNYLPQSNLRDQLLLQQKQTQLILNNYTPSGNNYIHLPNGEDLMVVDNVIPQHKFSENGLVHGNKYSSDYKLKDNRKSEEATAGEKASTDVSNRLGDDELGFDPFHETQKALADLMEKELLIQQNKQSLQHKNDQYYQSPQCYQSQHGFDGCQRGFNQLQINMLNQQNSIIGGKLLSQIHSQQILNSTNSKSSGSNRLDGVRCTLPPPGFASPSQTGPPTHLNSFGQVMSRGNNSRKMSAFMGLSSSESSFQPHYVPNGVTKADDWPENLRTLVQEGRTSSPSSVNPSYSSAPKGWSNVGNCSDWTALDPAIVSSSRSQHLSIHNQSLLNNQGLSHLLQNHLQNQMCQLNIGNVLGHNNWSSSHRQNDDNWSTHMQTTVPPPGFALPHTGGELKKSVVSGIEGLE
ncbi:hypothetical protein RUM44_001641 [Polyplax serrata]|uniref:CCR4-NOT transcription complex subunit 4 n=1 Tax=Polyplax serrata TaxID=468196 RepID=A0ABR1AM40_POLSC